MKEYQKAIIKFMVVKNKIIQKKIKEKYKNRKKKPVYISYVNDTDKRIIKTWSDNVSKKIVRFIKKKIDENSAYMATDHELCPFCVFHMKLYNTSYCRGCHECEYAKTHRVCEKSRSDYTRLITHISRTSLYGGSFCNSFTDEDYQLLRDSLKIIKKKEIE